MLLKLIHKEYAQLRVFNTNARKLIKANFLFGLFNPFYLIFANTFIFSCTHGNLSLNILYSSFSFLGISLGFVFNGFFLRYVVVKKQMVLGAFILLLAVVVMFLLPARYINAPWILTLGLLSGIGNGIYWSSRNYLTVVNTNNTNRDFFSGIDYILISAGRIITPFLIGIYIGEGIRMHWFSPQFAYRSTLIIAFLLLLSVALIILPRKYKTVKPAKYLYFRYARFWKNARKMFLILGLFQGAVTALPPVLIMKYLGNESSVGLYSSACYLVAIFLVYGISSNSGIKHRTSIIKVSSFVLLAGAIFFVSIAPINKYLATSVLTIVLFLLEPLLGFPARASFMKAIDELKYIERRNTYTYVVDIEIFTGIGRITSLIAFYTLFLFLPIFMALSIYISAIALLQFYNIRYSKKINGN